MLMRNAHNEAVRPINELTWTTPHGEHPTHIDPQLLRFYKTHSHEVCVQHEAFDYGGSNGMTPSLSRGQHTTALAKDSLSVVLATTATATGTSGQAVLVGSSVHVVAES